MKRILVAALAVLGSVTLGSTIAEAQSQKVSRSQSSTIVCKGKYSSGRSTTAVNTFTSGAVPLYSRLDTVVDAATDTFVWTPTGDYNSVLFHHDFLKAASSGTPTITAACYVSGNGGTTYDGTAIVTYTVNPTSLTAPVSKVSLINSAAGNPYGSYKWVFSNSASSTISAKGWVTPR